MGYRVRENGKKDTGKEKLEGPGELELGGGWLEGRGGLEEQGESIP